jgi:hypothetical protein
MANSCKQESKKVVIHNMPIISEKFQLVVTYMPSFDTPFVLKFDCLDSNRTVTMIPVIRFSGDTNSFSIATYNISDESYNKFIYSLNNNELFTNYSDDLLTLKSDNNVQIDGCSSFVFYTNNKRDTNSFYYNSSSDNSFHRQLTKSVIELARETINSQPQGSVIDKVSQYYHLFPGYRLLSNEPCYVKFTGHLDDDYVSEYKDLFKKLPLNKDIIFDLYDLNSTCLVFDSLIVNYLKQNRSIYWIIDDNSNRKIRYSKNKHWESSSKRDYLLMINAQKDRIFTNEHQIFEKIFQDSTSYPYFPWNKNRIKAGHPVPVPDADMEK